jgi:hypothetical protein
MSIIAGGPACQRPFLRSGNDIFLRTRQAADQSFATHSQPPFPRGIGQLNQKGDVDWG